MSRLLTFLLCMNLNETLHPRERFRLRSPAVLQLPERSRGSGWLPRAPRAGRVEAPAAAARAEGSPRALSRLFLGGSRRRATLGVYDKGRSHPFVGLNPLQGFLLFSLQGERRPGDTGARAPGRRLLAARARKQPRGSARPPPRPVPVAVTMAHPARRCRRSQRRKWRRPAAARAERGPAGDGAVGSRWAHRGWQLPGGTRGSHRGLRRAAPAARPGAARARPGLTRSREAVGGWPQVRLVRAAGTCGGSEGPLAVGRAAAREGLVAELSWPCDTLNFFVSSF